MSTDRCVRCASLRVARSTLEAFVAVEGETLAGAVQGLRCKTCSFEHVPHEELVAFQEAARAFSRTRLGSGRFRIRRAAAVVASPAFVAAAAS